MGQLDEENFGKIIQAKMSLLRAEKIKEDVAFGSKNKTIDKKIKFSRKFEDKLRNSCDDAPVNILRIHMGD
tara:strand:- start:182 stop:394 length:213 start_codon:yes stop_codon:yes gene_type:complete